MAITHGTTHTPESEVLFEFAQVGTSMRVTAVHVATGTEIVIQGHVHTPQAELRRVALNKLNYVMRKRQDEKR